MAWFMGIDIGSAYSKGVIVEGLELVAWHIVISGADYRASAETIRAELLEKSGLTWSDVCRVVASGCGADNVRFASQKVSDVICTARGINSVFPGVKTVIDVACQATKVIQVNEAGIVTNFAVSEKCAAGGGRFIEVIANVLRVNLRDFAALAAKSKSPVTLATSCAVFGESEAITRISEGVPAEDIAAGANKALATRISSLVARLEPAQPCAICGGGALNTNLVKSIETELNIKLLLPPHPHIITALGAAVIAAGAGNSWSNARS